MIEACQGISGVGGIGDGVLLALALGIRVVVQLSPGADVVEVGAVASGRTAVEASPADINHRSVKKKKKIGRYRSVFMVSIQAKKKNQVVVIRYGA